ncbi:hypothetical protein MARI_33880 (plasmid) [Marinobacter sp. JH2]|nr:relaxase/mobilization nuclease domain-containing protein [Marinobacter sp. JH2]QBM19242.1 hypothetical protein MARI_33880 [Marinobacter sp. JH2]
MKAKISRGGGFRGIAEYALGDEKEAEFVAGNVDGRTPRELSAEFSLTRRLRPKTPRPVWHCSLSLPKGERLDSERWEAVIYDFLDGMLFDRDNHQFFAVRHTDTDHDHVHIIVSRIGLDAGLWHGKWEARRAIDLTQKLEIQHGLTRTPGYSKKDEKSLTKGEIEMAVRTEQAPPRKVLQALIKKAAAGNPTVVQFAEKLAMSGVEVRANIASTGTLSGFSFGLDGYAFKGSQLGKKFSWKALKAQGVSYEQDRDREQLQRITRARAADSNDLRIAVDAGDDQRAAERVSEPDGQPTEGVYIPADRPDTEQARPAPKHDHETVVGDAGSGGDRHQEADFSVDDSGERSGRGDFVSDAARSLESLRRAGWGASEAGPEYQRSDDEAVGRSAAGAGVGSEGFKSPEQQLERIDAAYRKAVEELGGQRPSGSEGKPEGENSERSGRSSVVAGGGSGGNRVDVGKYADYLGILADRHTITPERACQAIDSQIAQHPAPIRPAGKKAPTGRLSRWFNSTKAKLSKFIEKARDYFNDAAVMSAGKGGWLPEEVRSAGLTGDLLSRTEMLQASEAAEQARQQQEAQASEAAKSSEMAEERIKAPEKPQEPDIRFFDDDGLQGPGLGGD